MAKVETERFFGNKGIIIMIRDGNKLTSAIFKDKKNADKFNRNNPSDVKKILQLAKKTKFPKAIDEGPKRYNQKDGVGKSKYVISYHDGKKKHKDGSDFFDIQIFRNKKDLAKFVNALHKGGYKYGFGESVNEVLVIVDKFDKRKQDYGKVYFSDGGNRPGDGDLKKAKKELEKLSKKHKGLTLISVGRNSKMYDVMKADESVNEGVFSNKQDAMNAYMNGKISAEKLDKIAKTYFKSSVATKQELQNFMKSGYMKELMANTYGLKVPAMEKKVKELMKYAS